MKKNSNDNENSSVETKVEHSQHKDEWWKEISTRFSVWKNQLSHQLASMLGQDGGTSLLTTFMQPEQQSSNQPLNYKLWILGKEYSPETDQLEFWTHFRSLVWMTYRLEFPSIATTLNSTDVGWGCMIRSGQSLLATALFVHYFGMEWRLGQVHYKERHWELYEQIMRMFLDEQSCRFSIHNIAAVGESKLGIPVGSWYGPSAIAQVLAELVGREPKIVNNSEKSLIVSVVTDGCLYTNKIREIFSADKSLVLLIPLRLGLGKLNPVYYERLMYHLKYPTTVGICGGRPNAALYFVGVEKDSLIYLDPHNARPAVPLKSKYSLEDFLTYHCDNPRKTSLDNVDPSLLIGHYFSSLTEFVDFCSSFNDEKTPNPLFSIMMNEIPLDDDLSIHSLTDED